MKRNYQITMLFVVFFVVLSLFAGCQPEPVAVQPSTPVPSSPAATAMPTTPDKPASTVVPEKTPVYPVTITDDIGRKVTIKTMPQRIVSMAPSNTEMLFALGLGDRIIGVTDYCDYPPEATQKPKVSGYTTPDVEKLVSIQPDLIIADAIHEKTVLPALEKLGFTVIIHSATSIDVILNEITRLGQVCGKENKAAELVGSMSTRLKAIQAKTGSLSDSQRLRGVYIIWFNPIWTMGGKTYCDDMIYAAGGLNIFSSDFEKSRQVSIESVVTRDPEVIVISGMAQSIGTIYTSVKTEMRLKSVKAIINDRVYKMSDSNLIERGSPRVIDGIDELCRMIHPEIFGALKQ